MEEADGGVGVADDGVGLVASVEPSCGKDMHLIVNVGFLRYCWEDDVKRVTGVAVKTEEVAMSEFKSVRGRWCSNTR